MTCNIIQKKASDLFEKSLFTISPNIALLTNKQLLLPVWTNFLPCLSKKMQPHYNVAFFPSTANNSSAHLRLEIDVGSIFHQNLHSFQLPCQAGKMKSRIAFLSTNNTMLVSKKNIKSISAGTSENLYTISSTLKIISLAFSFICIATRKLSSYSFDCLIISNRL